MEWISTRDRLPDKEGQYWVLWLGGIACPIYMLKMFWSFQSCWNNPDFYEIHSKFIHYWACDSDFEIPNLPDMKCELD